jgi:hypothetical protein
VWILSILYVLGNLASVPLIHILQPDRVEAPSWIALWSIANFTIVTISLYLAGRVGLGAPFLEGLLAKGGRLVWGRKTIAVSLLIAVIAGLPFFLLNRSLDPERLPPLWTLLLGSLDAGIQEEIFMRLFLVTSFTWLGSLKWRDAEGRPHPAVLWIAISLAAVIFGWSHVDDQVLNHGMHASLVPPMTVNTALGIAFGWAYWRLGFESAMLAHFLVDAIGTAVVIPGFLSGNPLLSAAVLISLILAGIGSWRLLTR